ncbi:hypothetical protein A5687_01720 [Mycobacterium mantenii]|nr:hypothetical protein A5687_01720 [Mycobacterium mantenii]
MVREMKNFSGISGITKPVGVPLSSTIAHGHAAIEMSRSPSSYTMDSTRSGMAASALKSISSRAWDL